MPRTRRLLLSQEELEDWIGYPRGNSRILLTFVFFKAQAPLSFKGPKTVLGKKYYFSDTSDVMNS